MDYNTILKKLQGRREISNNDKITIVNTMIADGTMASGGRGLFIAPENIQSNEWFIHSLCGGTPYGINILDAYHREGKAIPYTILNILNS